MGILFSQPTYNKFNLRPDTFSEKDLHHPGFLAPTQTKIQIKMPHVQDQGHLGSCTSFAASYMFRHDEPGNVHPSHLYLYYNERMVDNDVNVDAGSTIRNSIYCMYKYGMCQESLWPYDINRFTEHPPQECYNKAKYKRGFKYLRLENTLDNLRGCLEQYGPFICGVQVFESFENAPNGDVPMPESHDRFMGGHAICICGYDDETQRFTFINSWGTGWGKEGYGTLPYKYLTGNTAHDFWVIEKFS